MDDLNDRVDWKRVTGCSIRAWMKCLQDRFNSLNDVHYQSIVLILGSSLCLSWVAMTMPIHPISGLASRGISE